MARIPDEELVEWAMEERGYLRGQGAFAKDNRILRLVAALREAYQEIALLSARTAGAMPPEAPAVTTYTPHAPYFYQPHICPHCSCNLVVGIPHDCTTGAKP